MVLVASVKALVETLPGKEVERLYARPPGCAAHPAIGDALHRSDWSVP